MGSNRFSLQRLHKGVIIPITAQRLKRKPATAQKAEWKAAQAKTEQAPAQLKKGI